MKREYSMCPILTAASIVSGAFPIKTAYKPGSCMWAMRKTEKGKDGKYRTVGYRCAMAPGSDRYVDLEES